MKSTISLFLFSFLPLQIVAQSIDFKVMVLDTAEHFIPSPYDEILYDSDFIIDTDSLYRQVFLWSPFKLYRPNFKKSIWLKRTIRGTCLSQIENSILIDSSQQTLAWNSHVEALGCEEKYTRHFVVEIPKPPDDYEILFNTYHKKEDTFGSFTDVILDSLVVSSFACSQLQLASYFRNARGRAMIDNKTLFTEWKKAVGDCEENPDFTKYLILANTYGGDCLMRVVPHVYFDRITRNLVLNVYNIWGGCRAGGRESIVLIVKKPEEDFNIITQEIQLDSWSEYEEEIRKTKK